MLRIRKAVVDDVPLLLEMILEFATFEKLRDEVTITEATLTRDGFRREPRFHALIPEWDGKTAGYAICFPYYSSFQGPGLFLEDIFVRAEFRGKGIGKALMGEAGAMALREGFGTMRWEVLAWNQAAIDFYKRLGATFLDDWKEVRVSGAALQRMAGKA